MAYTSIRDVADLEPGYILVPERYDPRRASTLLEVRDKGGRLLSQVAPIVRRTLSPQSADPTRRYLVLDTGNARSGFIWAPPESLPAKSIGSAKKILEPGDVIISRLRPYLRQAAWVDDELRKDSRGELCVVVASTEFYVLKPPTNTSIAFLVPFLLSGSVQEVLAASQEGGHHPRFPENALSRLVIPSSVLARRDELSRAIEEAVRNARTSENGMRRTVELVGTL